MFLCVFAQNAITRLRDKVTYPLLLIYWNYACIVLIVRRFDTFLYTYIVVVLFMKTNLIFYKKRSLFLLNTERLVETQK